MCWLFNWPLLPAVGLQQHTHARTHTFTATIYETHAHAGTGIYSYKDTHTQTQLVPHTHTIRNAQAVPVQQALGILGRPYVWRPCFRDANSNHMLAWLGSGPLGDFTEGWRGTGWPNSPDNMTDAQASSTDRDLRKQVYCWSLDSVWIRTGSSVL